MNSNLRFYAVTFKDGSVTCTAVLHAHDEQDARYCISEGWQYAIVVNVVCIDDVQIGVIRPVYEQER